MTGPCTIIEPIELASYSLTGRATKPRIHARAVPCCSEETMTLKTVTHVGTFAAVLAACGAARQASFATAEPSCQQNPAMCESMCRTNPGSGECSVATVHAAEVAAQGNPHHLGVPALRALHNQVATICNDGIDRACAANQGLAPMIAKGIEDEHATAATAQAADAAQSDFQARVNQLKAEADEDAKLFAAGACRYGKTGMICPGGVGRNVSLALDRIAACGPSCAAQLGQQEYMLRTVRADVADYKDSLARKAALDQAKAGCKADPATCQQTCAGDAASVQCVALGVMFEVGDEVVAKGVKDPSKAWDLYKKGCAAQNQSACHAQRDMNSKAHECRALDTCKGYCDAGIGAGCFSLATVYQQGNGVAPNQATAMQYMKKACDLGDGAACDAVGTNYFEGTGVPRDRVTAERYFKRACDAQVARIQALKDPGDFEIELRDRWCHDQVGASCVNRVQSPAHRRPDLDAICRAKLLPTTAWSTLNGTDDDGCLNAMMNRACQEVLNLHAYCCPNN
jgi:TPR repeat protein